LHGLPKLYAVIDNARSATIRLIAVPINTKFATIILFAINLIRVEGEAQSSYYKNKKQYP
jgi:hypothetical protein